MKTICIFGPTACGKSSLAMKIADIAPVRIISVDAVQIYRHMNIGTAKPDQQLQKKYPHFLIDLIEPEETYSVARFCQDLQKEVEIAEKEGQIPLLVGGTMMYFYSLFQGVNELPEISEELKEKIDIEYKKDHGKSLYQRIKQVDTDLASRISENDTQRIIRFSQLLEVLPSDKNISQIFAEQDKQIPDFLKDSLLLGINCQRSVLHQRIENRLKEMFSLGFIEEVDYLHSRTNLTAEHPSMRAVGYRQIWQYLEGFYDKNVAFEKSLYATRQLAKRQITWMNNRFKNNLPEIQYLFSDQADVEQQTIDKVSRFLNL